VKSQNNFSAKSSERTWLVGILRHKIYDHLRKDLPRTCRARVDPMPADDEQSWEESLFWLHDVAAECQLPSRRMELDEFSRKSGNRFGQNCRRASRRWFSTFTP